MGYTTKFSGVLTFQCAVTAPMLCAVKAFFGEDCRDHPEWNAGDALYIDLRLTDDFLGIEWDNDTGKNHGMVEHVNLIIREMRKQFPDFGLCGTLTAQGEDIEDRWQLYIDTDGVAKKRDVVMVGKKVTCPHCDEKFYVE